MPSRNYRWPHPGVRTQGRSPPLAPLRALVKCLRPQSLTNRQLAADGVVQLLVNGATALSRAARRQTPTRLRDGSRSRACVLTSKLTGQASTRAQCPKRGSFPKGLPPARSATGSLSACQGRCTLGAAQLLGQLRLCPTPRPLTLASRPLQGLAVCLHWPLLQVTPAAPCGTSRRPASSCGLKPSPEF